MLCSDGIVDKLQSRLLEKTKELDRKYTEQSQGFFHRNMKLNLKSLCLTSLILLLMNCSAISTSNPTPTPWPEQFHALLYMNLSDAHLKLSDLWYDWPGGRNVNIFTRQLIGDILYDVEWDNGTSYYFTLGPNPTCRVMEFGVGIPRPDFLNDANYLGTQVTDGFLCHVWEKVDFIWYYEDVITKRPVRWDFYDGISSHVITYEVGAVLPDSVTQAPAHCFNQEDSDKSIATSFTNFRLADFDLIK